MDGCQTTRLLKNLHRLPEIVGAYRHAGDWLDLSLRDLGMASPSFPYDVRLRDGVRFRFESTEEIRARDPPRDPSPGAAAHQEDQPRIP